jgi:REP element-mobilizing transposase RayT
MTSAPTITDQSDLEVPRTRARREVTHECAYQVVWCTKFARPLLADVRDELRDILTATCAEMGAQMESVVITDEVVSLQVKVDPTQGVHRVVTQMKAVSSSTLRSRHPGIKSRAPSLWNSKYLVSSLGTGAQPQRLRDFLEQQRRG